MRLNIVILISFLAEAVQSVQIDSIKVHKDKSKLLLKFDDGVKFPEYTTDEIKDKEKVKITKPHYEPGGTFPQY